MLQGKVALVTGASRGIGKAIASSLLRQGASVTGTGRAISSENNPAINWIACDFTEEASVTAFLAQLENLEIDILVNNAGINVIADFASISSKDFLDIQNVNLYGPFRTMQAVLKNMKLKKWGRIVNIASIWSKISKRGRASYSASKFGLDGLTLALSHEVAEHGILCNCVSPGFTLTELTMKTIGASGNALEQVLQLVPLKRMADPSEIAELVLWLCSPQNTYVTGQNIAIDGGFSRG